MFYGAIKRYSINSTNLIIHANMKCSWFNVEMPEAGNIFTFKVWQSSKHNLTIVGGENGANIVYLITMPLHLTSACLSCWRCSYVTVQNIIKPFKIVEKSSETNIITKYSTKRYPDYDAHCEVNKAPLQFVLGFLLLI